MASGEVSSPASHWNILGYLIRKRVSLINFKRTYLNNQSQVEKTDFQIRMLKFSSFKSETRFLCLGISQKLWVFEGYCMCNEYMAQYAHL